MIFLALVQTSGQLKSTQSALQTQNSGAFFCMTFLMLVQTNGRFKSTCGALLTHGSGDFQNVGLSGDTARPVVSSKPCTIAPAR